MRWCLGTWHRQLQGDDHTAWTIFELQNLSVPNLQSLQSKRLTRQLEEGVTQLLALALTQLDHPKAPSMPISLVLGLFGELIRCMILQVVDLLQLIALDTAARLMSLSCSPD